MRKNTKADAPKLVNPELMDETLLERKRREAARSDRARSDSLGGYTDLGRLETQEPAVGTQLLRELADLDLSDPTQVELTDYVKISLELPLWQVLALARHGDVNTELVGLLGECLNGEEANSVYLARLNAMILKAASGD